MFESTESGEGEPRPRAPASGALPVRGEGFVFFFFLASGLLLGGSLLALCFLVLVLSSDDEDESFVFACALLASRRVTFLDTLLNDLLIVWKPGSLCGCIRVLLCL